MSDRLDKRRRWLATAKTWAEKTAALLRYDAEHAGDEERWLIGYDAERFLSQLLDAADDLVSILNDENSSGQALYKARALARRLRDRELAAKLERVEGRLPEEADVFLRKATELQERARIG